jgi:multisubunit Na+/H+ antiporter MnhE subunit
LTAKATWLGWWVAMLALYLALADSRQPAELALGGLVAAAGASAAVAIRAGRPAGAALERSLLARIPPNLWRLVSETVVVFAFVVRRLAGRRARGRFRAVSFRAGGSGRRDVARRAFAEAAGSLGPNTIVVGVDEDRDLILVHQLVTTEAGLDPLGEK